MNVSWIVPSAYVIKVSTCVTRKNRIIKGKLLGEKMEGPRLPLSSSPIMSARSALVTEREPPRDV